MGVLLLVMVQAPAAATDPTVVLAEHGIEAACRETTRTAEPFNDIAPGGVHAEAISCLWAYGITSGQVLGNGEVRFSPTSTVTREQMASFVANSLDVLTDDVFALPDPDEEVPYADAAEISDAHRANVARLTEAGIVRGHGDGTFRPLLQVSRQQMATYLVSAIEAVTGEDLPRDASFDDVADTHLASIEKLATIGVASGTTEDTFSPRAPVTRQQMASFLARTLDHLASEGLLEPLSIDPGTGASTLGLVDVEVAAHDGFDRVTFTLAGDEQEAGWRVGYVDEAHSAGSGDPVEVDGEAVLQVTLTGIAVPGDLPPAVEDDLWVEGEITFGGDAVVEVIDDTVFEGQQELFVGTTGRHPFEVQRLDDPQRIHVDVQHPAGTDG